MFRAGVRVDMVLADAALVRDNNFRFLRAAVLKVPVVLMCDCGETDRERQHSHSWTIKSIVYGASDITSRMTQLSGVNNTIYTRSIRIPSGILTTKLSY